MEDRAGWKVTDIVITIFKIPGRNCCCYSQDGMWSACPTSHTQYILRGGMKWKHQGQALLKSLQKGILSYTWYLISHIAPDK